MTTFDYRVYDEFDNGEFITGCKLDLLEDGKVVATESFTASSEEPGLPSAYYTGSGNHAVTQALSYANAWVEAEERRAEAARLGVHPLELAFAPYGEEWQREQRERADEGR